MTIRHVPQNPSEAINPEYREQVREVADVIFGALGVNGDDPVQAQIAIAALTVALQEAIVANCLPAQFWAKWISERITNLQDVSDNVKSRVTPVRIIHETQPEQCFDSVT